jgi:glycolate oxidase FAD binding subunit
LSDRTLLASVPFDLALGETLGDRLHILPDECAAFAIAGCVPKSVAQPAGPDEAAFILKAADAEGAVVVLRGAGTKSHRPPPPRAVDLVLDLRTIAGIVEHAAPDLTATALAGTTLAELDRTLEKAGQFWPCDAPHFEAATIGGTLAANANGALRQRYGALRDLVAGARFITAQGTHARAGSRVVKSVAGYDTHKLLVGSFGTLALIVEATLKIAPLPQAERALVARFERAADASAAAADIARSPLYPMAMTLHDGKSAHRVGALLAHGARDRWLLVVRCGGNRRSVERQLDGAAAACKAAGCESVADLDRPSTKRAWSQIRELAAGAEYSHDRWVALKAVSMPSQVPEVLETVSDALPSAETTSHPWAGVCYVHVPLDDTSIDLRDIATACSRLAERRALLTMLAAPPACASLVPDVPAPKLPVRLLRAVKSAFDPAGVLDPGRLPGGV